jgi:hypothetical protein
VGARSPLEHWLRLLLLSKVDLLKLLLLLLLLL